MANVSRNGVEVARNGSKWLAVGSKWLAVGSKWLAVARSGVKVARSGSQWDIARFSNAQLELPSVDVELPYLAIKTICV